MNQHSPNQAFEPHSEAVPMTPEIPANPVRRRGALRTRQYLLSLGVFTLDQLTKGWIERQPAGTYIRVIPHFFQIVQVYNRGAAFGIFQNSSSRLTLDGLIFVSIMALAVIFSLLWKSPLSRRAGWALALILGGAAGNLFDRLLRGRVTDFLLFYIGRHQWPAFNCADSAIVIGAGLLIWDILFEKKDRETPAISH